MELFAILACVILSHGFAAVENPLAKDARRARASELQPVETSRIDRNDSDYRHDRINTDSTRGRKPFDDGGQKETRTVLGARFGRHGRAAEVLAATASNATAPVNVGPGPVDTKGPEPAEAKKPGPVETQAPGPTETKATGPAKIQAPGPVETIAAGPVEAKAPVPVEAKAPGPVETKAKGLVETKAARPVETMAAGPAEIQAPGPVETKAEGPVEKKLDAEIGTLKSELKVAEALQKENDNMGKGMAKSHDVAENGSPPRNRSEAEQKLNVELQSVRVKEKELTEEAERMRLNETEPQLNGVKKGPASNQTLNASEGAPGLGTPVVDDLTLIEESRSVWNCLLNELPEELKLKVEKTNVAEGKLLTDQIAYHSVPPESLHAYTAAQETERTLLGDLLPELGADGESILAAYKALRKGEAWTYVKLDKRYKDFFVQPSEALKAYELLKSEEKSTLDGFLSSPRATQEVSANTTSPAVVKEEELEEEDTMKRRARDAGLAASREDSNGTDRGLGDGGMESTRMAQQSPGDGLGETSSGGATTEAAGTLTFHVKSSLVKVVILSALIVVLIVTIVVVIGCRKKIIKWRMKHRRRQLGIDTEPSHGYSQLDDSGTDCTERLAQFSISLATAKAGGFGGGGKAHP